MKQINFLGAPSKGSSDQSSDAISQWKLYVDGASRNNPGPSGAGIHILKNDHVVENRGFFLGTKTNNQAEYFALLLGLWYINQRMGADDLLLVVSDSQLLVRQLEGKYRVKHPALKPLFALAQEMLRSTNYSIAHVLREDNVDADAMANKGIDEKVPVPKAFAQLAQEKGLSL